MPTVIGARYPKAGKMDFLSKRVHGMADKKKYMSNELLLLLLKRYTKVEIVSSTWEKENGSTIPPSWSR